MRSHDITELVAFEEQPDGSVLPVPLNLDKHPCSFCGTPCYRICWIGSRLACVECFRRLAVEPALAAEETTT